MTATEKMTALVKAFITEHGGTAGAIRAIKQTPASKQTKRGRRLLLKYVRKYRRKVENHL